MDMQNHKRPETVEEEGLTPTLGFNAVDSDVAIEESAQDENATAQKARQRRMPDWFEVLWSNCKARIGLMMLVFFIVVAIFAQQIAPYDPRDISFGPSQGRARNTGWARPRRDRTYTRSSSTAHAHPYLWGLWVVVWPRSLPCSSAW
ncbi:hypothetical protein [Dictyobacter kobayashii]|uniref:Oligopeptide transport permease C-like N-terminal domain-containing protein n=1 Tax=Dictyobacter kobayashii TaxID=2014872 RepID=A0A402ASE4_9CHLR|nr:hypothetical protein [Dictyobacter kobayashii]GCE22012.1 hypothetical protein KDK_58120 [Dictyobacter kobayashii]